MTTLRYHNILGCVFILIMLLNASFGFQVRGNMSMTNDTEMVEEAAIGDLVTISFDLMLELDSEMNDVIFVFTGDSLKFPGISSYRAITWNLSLINETLGIRDDVNNDSFGVNSTMTFNNLFITECVAHDNDTAYVNVTDSPLGGACYNDTENIDERMQFLDSERSGLILNMSSGLPGGNWSFDGAFDMELDDTVVQGSMVRGILEIWVIENGTLVSSKYVTTDLVTIPAPGILIDTPSSLTQPILGLFTTHVILNTTRDSLTATIGCLTPYENGTNEVKLTLQSMRVVAEATTGIHENTTEFLEDFGHGVMTSTIGSYQMNKAVLYLDRIPRYAPLFSQMEVTSSYVVRVEDYSKLADGDKLDVKMNIRFQDSTIWVGEIIISLDAPEVRKPSLKVTVTQTKQCPYDGSTTATMSVLVAHDSHSTATAYNVTLNIFLPPYINMISKSFSTPKENKITVEQEGNVINAEIARLTFSDPFTLTAGLDLDLSNNLVLHATNRIVTAEALYNDRWGNMTDMMTETAFTSLSIRKFCAKRITWGSPGSCLPGACSCVVTGYSPTKCVPCGEMWRCKAFVDDRDPHFPLAIKNFGIQHDIWVEISPRVAVITGQDSESGHYYAISNNGAIYMVSEDQSQTWKGVTDDAYTTATSKPSFQWATFI